ncbi:MAG: hypothetical protein FD121_220, partial [Gallionellaceae bacterium]
ADTPAVGVSLEIAFLVHLLAAG